MTEVFLNGLRSHTTRAGAGLRGRPPDHAAKSG
jgi:hypothetical protein